MWKNYQQPRSSLDPAKKVGTLDRGIIHSLSIDQYNACKARLERYQITLILKEVPNAYSENDRMIMLMAQNVDISHTKIMYGNRGF